MLRTARRLFAVVLCVCVVAGGAKVALADGPEDGITMRRIVWKHLSNDVVVDAVQEQAGVEREDGSTCPVGALVVSFDDPGESFESGAHITPLGTSDDGRTVNGIVLCEGSDHAYVGFQGILRDGSWEVFAVPDPEGSHAHKKESAKPKSTPKPQPPPPPVIEDHEVNRPDPAPAPPPASASFAGKYAGPEIEGYARYDGQTKCDPVAKPGTLNLRNLLLARYPSTTSFGIERGCDVGGRSEHKEGRAFDWGANIGSPADRDAVADFLDNKLFATDKYGNRHAMARRMGVMYVIWNKKIWGAYKEGWQPYEGSSAHTDHVHISLSRDGAHARTSFWSGKVVAGLPSSQGGGWRHDDDDDDGPQPTPWQPPPVPTMPPVVPTPSPFPTPTGSPVTSPSPTPDDQWWWDED